MMRVETLDLFDVFVGFTGVEFQVRALCACVIVRVCALHTDA